MCNNYSFNENYENEMLYTIYTEWIDNKNLICEQYRD